MRIFRCIRSEWARRQIPKAHATILSSEIAAKENKWQAATSSGGAMKLTTGLHAARRARPVSEQALFIAMNDMVSRRGGHPHRISPAIYAMSSKLRATLSAGTDVLESAGLVRET